MGFNVASFLINTLFDFYLIVALLRFILQWLHADYYNPISQFTIKLTDPVLKPLRKLLPSIRGIDTALFVLLLICAMVKNALLIGLQYQIMPSIPGLLLLALVNILAMLINLFFYAILLRAILSWLGPRGYNPAIQIIQLVTEPLLASVRRWIPAIGGIDLSPLLVIVGLQLINMVLIERLLIWGIMLAL